LPPLFAVQRLADGTWLVRTLERDLILQRTNEGRARAMAEGTRFGRKPKLTKRQAREALKR
jgi:DNA invertase Pin-like site-specific DNA recombinase